MATGCVETDGKVRVVSGIEGMENHVLPVREVYPDLHLTIERQIADRDRVVTLVTARGTHRGRWLGMKPTGRPLVFTGVNVDRVRDGRIPPASKKWRPTRRVTMCIFFAWSLRTNSGRSFAAGSARRTVSGSRSTWARESAREP